MSEKRNTSTPETVTVRKTILHPFSVPPLCLFKSFVGLVFLGSIFILFLALKSSVNSVFYVLIIFQQTGHV